jgi:NADH dehydrogenase FAD-containing subunit
MWPTEFSKLTRKLPEEKKLIKTIILAGSGHAHLEIIKSLSEKEISESRFCLISPHRQTYYSGLIPRLIAGQINSEKLTIQSADFAEAKQIEFIQDFVTEVDQSASSLILSSGRTMQYDLLSLNLGGTAAHLDSQSPNETIYLRPFDTFMAKWREIEKSIETRKIQKFVVIGGGAAAVEVATALRIRLNTKCAGQGDITLVSKSARLCEGYSKKISASILENLMSFKIDVRLNEPIEKIMTKHLVLKGGAELDFDSVFVVTPTLPSKMITGQIDSKLFLSSKVLAAGDCTTMSERPGLPRSGVIAVHEGRHLVQTIRDILSGHEPKDFRIPARQLNILISGEETARFVWGSLSLEGRWPLRLKNWIDERYINKFKL